MFGNVLSKPGVSALVLVTAYEAVQDLTPKVVPQCCKNSSSDIIQAEKNPKKN